MKVDKLDWKQRDKKKAKNRYCPNTFFVRPLPHHVLCNRGCQLNVVFCMLKVNGLKKLFS